MINLVVQFLSSFEIQLSAKVSEVISFRYILLMIVKDLTRKLKSDLTTKVKEFKP